MNMSLAEMGNLLTKCVRTGTAQSSTIFISLTSSKQIKYVCVCHTEESALNSGIFLFVGVP